MFSICWLAALRIIDTGGGLLNNFFEAVAMGVENVTDGYQNNNQQQADNDATCIK
jgi:hypothetical protein